MENKTKPKTSSKLSKKEMMAYLFIALTVHDFDINSINALMHTVDVVLKEVPVEEARKYYNQNK